MSKDKELSAEAKAKALRVAMHLHNTNSQLTATCPDEDGEMCITIKELGEEYHFCLQIDEAEELGYFLIEHVKNDRISSSPSPK